MKYWDDFRSTWGFGDGDNIPDDATAARHIYVREINRLAARRRSKVRLLAWDRPGLHNPCMIVSVPARIVRGVPERDLCIGQQAGGYQADNWDLDDAPADKGMDLAVRKAMQMNLDHLIGADTGDQPTDQPLDYHCTHCGSRDVRRDADARWNLKTQAWDLCAVYDHATCEQCGGETSLKEVPLDPLPHAKKGKP